LVPTLLLDLPQGAHDGIGFATQRSELVRAMNAQGLVKRYSNTPSGDARVCVNPPLLFENIIMPNISAVQLGF